MNFDYVTAGTTLLVGLVAWVVFLVTKRNEKQNAATILLMDIRKAEATATTILMAGIVDTRQFSKILHENNWSKFKHLFASSLSNDDFVAFNTFFDSCMELDNARERIEAIITENHKAKSAIILQKIADIPNLASQEGIAKKQEIIAAFGNDPYSFDPVAPVNRIKSSIQLMGKLSTSVAFEKLRKIAKLKG